MQEDQVSWEMLIIGLVHQDKYKYKYKYNQNNYKDKYNQYKYKYKQNNKKYNYDYNQNKYNGILYSITKNCILFLPALFIMFPNITCS